MREAIQIAALAFLLLLAGALTVVLRQWLSAREEANAPPPPQQVIEKAPPGPAATPQPVDLGAVLGFGSLADCSQSPALASVLEQMVRIDPRTFESRRGGPIRVPGYDRPITPAFERRRHTGDNVDMREVEADLDLPGRWHGLAVAGLRRYFHEESDVAAFAVRFAEPPERVRETLVRHGFRLPPVGAFRVVEDDEMIAMSIGVERIEGEAALTCTQG